MAETRAGRPSGDSRSDVWHYEGLTYWSPLSAVKVESVLDLIPLQSDDQVLDIGCGRAEILLRQIERHGVRGTGLDRSSWAIELARRAASERVPDAQLEWVNADLDEYNPEPGTLACITCLGGPRLGATLGETIAVLKTWLRPGGYLLMGEGFWAQQPPPGYLQATGIPADDLDDHCGNMRAGRDQGLILLYTCVSDRDEWDVFEGRILYNAEQREAERQTRGAPEPEGGKTIQQRRDWYDAQSRWGRDTMGFGLYLFRA